MSRWRVLRSKLTDSTGAAVGPGDGVFYTNAAGEIVIEGLEPGTSITAREIKTVDGFVLDGTPKTVKITAGPPGPRTDLLEPAGGRAGDPQAGFRHQAAAGRRGI